MPLELLFSLASTLALTGWVALLAAPLRPGPILLYAGRFVPLALASLYAALVLGYWTSGSGGFSSLADVGRLFASPQLLLAGWVHYLSFDLFIGAWQVSEARRRGIGYFSLLPCLALTFLFGPAGLLLFLSLSGAKRLVAAGQTPPGDPAHV